MFAADDYYEGWDRPENTDPSILVHDEPAAPILPVVEGTWVPRTDT